LIWDIPLAVGAAEPVLKDLSEKIMAAWWADLAQKDATTAYVAIFQFAQAPKAAVAFLGQRLSPIAKAEVEEIDKLVNDLASDTFKVREQANQKLSKLGIAGEPALRRALEGNPVLEFRLRLQKLLENLNSGPTGESMRALRAIAALEYAGTPEARQFLKRLSDGAQGAWQTDEANAALSRLVSR
jgi:hypothetical protein